MTPLVKVKRANENADRRRQRRAMPETELVRLLYVTRLRPLAEYGRETIHKQQSETAGRKRWTTAPLTLNNIEAATERARERLKHTLHFIEQQERLSWERALIFKTMILTGLRQGELASLSIGQVFLDEPMPYLDLDPADEKNREGSQILLRRDLADDLTEWIASMKTGHTGDFGDAEGVVSLPLHQGRQPDELPATTPLFTVPDQMVKILDRDLKAAGIPKHDGRGRVIDMQALRRSFGTYLSKGGVAPRTAQAAMRHSKIDLTMNVYTDPKLLDVHGALDVLPALPISGHPQREHIAATGTDDTLPRPLAPILAQNSRKRGTEGSSPDKMAPNSTTSTDARPVAVSAGMVKQKDPLSIADNGSQKRGRRDTNPQPPDRQSGGTLHYPTLHDGKH